MKTLIKKKFQQSFVLPAVAGLALSSMLCIAEAAPVTTANATESTAVVGNPTETSEAPRGSQPTPSPVEAAAAAEEEAAEPPVDALYFGGDLYLGRTNLDGVRHLRDGFWAAGTSLAYPSVLQLRLTTRRGAEAKLALGVGHMYTDDASTLDQPHEAWYRTPVSGVNLTAGKYYVPFALQEWQYETKWGVMGETQCKEYTLAASLNYNQNLNTTNAYARLGRNFGEKVNAGLSLGAGRGLSYDTDFNRALGLDATASWNGWNLYSEYVRMRQSGGGSFRFGWLKLEYDKLGKFKPFLAHWRWNDTTDTFGSERSNGIGASYELTPSLAIQGGLADTREQNKKWIELHWTPEWRLWKKSPRADKGIPQVLAPQPR
jgi:hypothetical protein